MTYEPLIDKYHADLRKMVQTYLNDLLIAAPFRPPWFAESLPDGQRFVFLVKRYALSPTNFVYATLSQHWRIFRLAVMIAANGRCGKCSKPADELHHITYERVEHEYLTDVMPLCVGCHHKEHDHESDKPAAKARR